MPKLFSSGQGGVNGLVGSHLVMSIVALGAMILTIPMAMTRLGDQKPFWNDALRAMLLATWVAAILVNVIEGFYIELHQDVFQTKLIANQNIYGQIQSLVGIFVLAGAAMILLAIDYYNVRGLQRQIVGCIMAPGLALSVSGGFAWVFVDTTKGSWPFWTHIIGVVLVGLGALLSMALIYSATAHAKSSVAPTTPAAPPAYLRKRRRF
jgi:hypothetical protein